MEGVKVDLPYPSVSGIENDIKSAEIIFPAYAGLHGELSAILQYIYHALFFKKENDEKTAELLTAIAITEMHHLDILGETILALGVKPIYKVPSFEGGYYNTFYVSQSTTSQKMLLDDITAEMNAVREYSLMAEKLRNEKVAAIITRIKMDEELHVLKLKEALNKYS